MLKSQNFNFAPKFPKWGFAAQRVFPTRKINLDAKIGGGDYCSVMTPLINTICQNARTSERVQ